MRSRAWFLLSLLLLAAAVWFWQRGDEEVAKRKARRAEPGLQAPGKGTPSRATTPASNPAVPTTSAVSTGTTATAVPGTATPNAPASASPNQSQFPYRLANTTKSAGELGRSDTAILLENAFIDTASVTPWEVPEHLRAEGDPGSYIVQSRGPVDGGFYARLREAGAEFVSYIPNNAALVRASAQQAQRLAGLPQTRAVLRYEPYYKLAQALLGLAVEGQSLPLDRRLNLTLFSGQREAVAAALGNLGAEVLGEDRTPFGPLLTVRPHPDSLAALAQLPGVQRIEYASQRSYVNDLSRVQLTVSTNTVTAASYLGLSGTNVLVNINDSGVDEEHPDLTGRVFSTDTNTVTLQDFHGHGTHVGGTIASSGASSPRFSASYFGSASNANFRGMAPAAGLFVLPIDLLTGPLLSDAYLQETAARENFLTRGRTNAIISNNSWAYVGAFEYNSISASYDAAVRDALPGQPGSQPVLYVFAAGNSGFGNTNGVGGDAETILSPATAKNVITVGAIEHPRNITNELVLNCVTTNMNGTNVTICETNAPFLGMTDSLNEVADFSSRGNVGVGREGDFGRFKPDVVAPGTFVISTRSQHWRLTNQVDTTSPLYPILDSLNAPLGPHYRFESGTSMAAPAVSGMLALMQEFFEQKLQRRFSPALMKALLINGARTVNPTIQGYDLQVRKTINYQGWGLVNLTNSLPGPLTNATDEASWPIRLFDQSPTNVIATGQRHTWNLTVSTNARFVPLRATLVWTDPPGNPGAAIKLVNDLDLVVTNLESGEVFTGNNFPENFDFTVPNDTNSPPEFDFVNNVENVFISDTLSTNYSVTVIGRRVNVNAVTDNITDVVQDYALVISSGDGQVTNAFSSLTRAGNDVIPRPPLAPLTNGLPLLEQRVGANFQLINSTNGVANQWRFYVFTNDAVTNFTSLRHGSNVAFITFIPPNLSRPRNLDADIDLYVSRDGRLTNLEPTVVANSFKSLNRGGTEVVFFTNAVVSSDEIFYIGVKSEDQQGAEYGIVGLSTDDPFDQDDGFGNRILRGMPANVPIPDGAPSQPGAAFVFAVGTAPQAIARVIVTNEVTHQSIGDLLGNLSHENSFAVLNNHNRFDGTTRTNFLLVYDDSNSGQIFSSRNTDGPGSLMDFVGGRSDGVWLLMMEDNTLNRTGLVNSLTLRVEPQRDLNAIGGVTNCVLANQWDYYFLDIPVDASRVTVTLSQTGAPLNLYIRRGALPTTTDFDKSALINPPGGQLSIGAGDVPPLNAGRYFIGVFNPSAATECYVIRAVIDRDLASVLTQSYGAGAGNLLDDAITNLSLLVTNNRLITDVQIGVRVDHARASDLVFHLISPQGNRILLAENRGRTNALGYGRDAYLITPVVVTNSGVSGPENRLTVDTGTNRGSIKIDYDFYASGVADTMRIYYDGFRIFDSGPQFGTNTVRLTYGPGVSNLVTIVMNEGGLPPPPSLWKYRAEFNGEAATLYTVFTEDTNLTTTPIKFGSAPFAGGPVGANLIYTNSFEGAAPGDYCAVTNFDGWQVTSNMVTVVSNVALSHTGTNYLALMNGELSLDMPTVAGRMYQLQHVYRRSPPDTSLVSWWRGEDNLIDSVSSNNGTPYFLMPYAAGQVGRAFNFDGPLRLNVGMRVPPVASLNVQSFTIDAWINPRDLTNSRPVVEYYSDGSARTAVSLRINHQPGGTVLPGALYANIRPVGLAIDHELVTPAFRIQSNVWQHVALTYDQPSGVARLYHNGIMVATANPGSFAPATVNPIYVGVRPSGSADGLGGTNFFGQIDEVDVFNRALAPAEIRAIFLASFAGKCGASTFPFPTPISWWPGEGNAIDIADGNNGALIGGVSFPAGMVGRAFSFDGASAAVSFGNTVGNFDTNDFTVEFWMRTTATDHESVIEKWPICANSSMWSIRIGSIAPWSGPGRLEAATTSDAAGSDLNAISAGRPINDGLFHHVALVRQGTNLVFYIDGVLDVATNVLSGSVSRINNAADMVAGRSVCVGVDGTSPFTGQLDELAIYGQALDACDVKAIYNAGAKGKYSLLGRTGVCDVQADVNIEGRLGTIISGRQNWQTNLVTFRATQNSSPLLIRAREPEMWLDTFALTEITTPGNYFLPEETLRSLFGQSAFGTWRLEVWDNRVGAFINPSPVLGWELSFIFARTNPPAKQLTNCLPAITNIYSIYDTNCVQITNQVSGSEIKYFYVDVPRSARFATNVLTGTGNLLLAYNSTGLPAGFSPPDDIPPVFVPAPGGVALILDTNTPPQLRPGQRYYLGVANASGTGTNDFTISVIFDQTDGSLISVRTLTNGVCYRNTVPATNALDYYQFTVSTNAQAVSFALNPVNDDVNLVVRKARPVADPLPAPNPGRFDYISQNPGTQQDEIIVTASSLPVPLAPGIWYVGVFNVAAVPVTYDLCVTESTNSTFFNIIPLTNGVPLNYTIGAGSALTNYFLLSVNQTNSAVLFELYNLNSSADLLVDVDAFPTRTSFLSRDLGLVNAPAQIVLRTNVFFPSINGAWYLGVDNVANANLSFTIRAVVSTNGILPSGLPLVVGVGPALPPDTGLTFTWYSVIGEKYVIETSPDLVNWTLVATLTATGKTTSFNDPDAGSQPWLFYRLTQIP